MSERRLVFDRPRDAVLYALAINGWACESADGGHLGFSSYMSNAGSELTDLLDVEEATEAAVESGFTDPAELIGHFVVSQVGAHVDVLSFPNEDAVRAAYDLVEGLYNRMEGTT